MKSRPRLPQTGVSLRYKLFRAHTLLCDIMMRKSVHCVLLHALDTSTVMDRLQLLVTMPSSETIDHIHSFQALVISFILYLPAL